MPPNTSSRPSSHAAPTFLNFAGVARPLVTTPSIHGNLAGTGAHTTQTSNVPSKIQPSNSAALSTASSIAHLAHLASESQARTESPELSNEPSRIDNLPASEGIEFTGISNEPVKIRVVSSLDGDGSPLNTPQNQQSSSATMPPGPSRYPTVASSETTNVIAKRE
jgi:hypothetical protein